MADNTNQSVDRPVIAAQTTLAPPNWGDVHGYVWANKDTGCPASESSMFPAGMAPAATADQAVLPVTTRAAENHLPPLELADFKEEALKVFNKLDPNHTGAVTTEQLARAVSDPSITGPQAEALAALYGVKHGELELVAGNPARRAAVLACTNPEVLTLSELQDMPSSKTVAQKDNALIALIDSAAGRAALDSDGDGRISSAEIQNSKYAKFVGMYDRLSQDYAASHLRPDEQARVKQSGLTYEELGDLRNETHLRAFEGTMISERLHKANMSTAHFDQPGLYATGDNPLQSINADDVKQGEAGDCYFDAVLSSVAGLRPDIIRDSIKENANGSYTVTFKGDPEHPVTVAPPTDTELDLYNAAGSDGVWANVIEKAFADHQILFNGHHGKNFGADDTMQDAVSGGRETDTLKLLTGKGDEDLYHQYIDPKRQNDFEYDYAEKLSQSMDALKEAASTGEYAFVATHPGKATAANGLAPNHAYSVVGYEDGPNGGTFILRNPWDDQTRKDGAYFKISGDQLAQSIENVTTSPRS